MKVVGRLREIQRFGMIQRPDPLKPPIRFLRSYLQLLKERELMHLFKFSKVYREDGEREERRRERRIRADGRLEYHQVQRERKEQKRVDRLVEKLRIKIEEFLDQVRVGFVGRFDGGRGT